MRVVTAGCDPHLDSISVATVDGLGRELAGMTVGNGPDGWAQLVRFCTDQGTTTVGVEAASGYGRCLSECLTRAGFTVREIPTRLTASLRKEDGASKTDPGDARAIARAAARGEGSVWVNHTDLETIRVLTHRREALVRTQNQEINQLRALITEVDPDRAARLPRIRSRRQLVDLTRLHYRGDSHRETVADLINQIAAECLRRHDQINQLRKEMEKRLPPPGRALMAIEGCGLITACQILAEIAGTGGFTTHAKMAAWAGTAPLDASSGRQQRHRLNRGGNRQANRAIHTITITQLRRQGPAADYIARRTKEGKTQREAIRAAKRHITRRIWKTLRDHGLT